MTIANPMMKITRFDILPPTSAIATTRPCCEDWSMPNVRLTITILCVAGLGLGLRVADLSARAADAENWSRFRGPNGTGVSAATNLPVEFGPEKSVKWKTPLPPGHSSPVFTDTHIFL